MHRIICKLYVLISNMFSFPFFTQQFHRRYSSTGFSRKKKGIIFGPFPYPSPINFRRFTQKSRTSIGEDRFYPSSRVCNPEPARQELSGPRKNRSRGGYPIASRDRLRTAYTDRWDYLILNLAGMAPARIIAIVERTSVAW